MAGENDVEALMRTMQPKLFAAAYSYAAAPVGQMVGACFAQIAEDEGVTVVATIRELRAQGIEFAVEWGRISLTVHSDLAAVGLTAAIAAALGAQGISANVVAGYYHDHVFVQWDRREDAMAALRRLSDA